MPEMLTVLSSTDEGRTSATATVQFVVLTSMNREVCHCRFLPVVVVQRYRASNNVISYSSFLKPISQLRFDYDTTTTKN